MFTSLTVSLLLGLGASIRVSEDTGAPDFSLGEGESELVFIRHGLSLNNVFKDDIVGNVITMGKLLWNPVNLAKTFGASVVGSKEKALADAFETEWKDAPDSDFKTGYEIVCNEQKLCGPYLDGGKSSSLGWEVQRMSRDCLLHPTKGDQGAAELQKTLSGVLPQKHFFDKVFVSPLRRTLQTAIRALGPWMNETNTALLPWIHETYKSDSDLANSGLINKMFLGAYKNMIKPDETLRKAMVTLQDHQHKLGEWVAMYGPRDPSATQPDDPIAKADMNEYRDYPFYPGLDGTFSKKESKSELEGRMAIVRKLLTKLPPGRYAFVSHGGIGNALFGKKFENLAVMTARFKHTADPLDKENFFHDVMWGRDRWATPELLGERDH